MIKNEAPNIQTEKILIEMKSSEKKMHGEVHNDDSESRIEKSVLEKFAEI